MGLHRDYDEGYLVPEYFHEEQIVDLPKKKQIRRLLEKKLEEKRLREEFDELDGEFKWDDF